MQHISAERSRIGRGLWVVSRLTLQFLAMSAFVTVGGIRGVAAETDVPLCSSTAYNERDQHTNLDPLRPFIAHLGPLRFAVPWKYLSPRPARNLPTCILGGEVIAVQFWIPDGRAPENNLSWKPEFNPVEANGPSEPGASVIKVESIGYYETLDSKDLKDPDVRIARLLSVYGRGASLRKDGDLTAVTAPNLAPQFPIWYRQNAKESLFVRCLGNQATSICQNFLDLKDRHLSVFFLSTFQAVQNNSITISTLRGLLQRWELAR